MIRIPLSNLIASTIYLIYVFKRLLLFLTLLIFFMTNKLIIRYSRTCHNYDFRIPTNEVTLYWNFSFISIQHSKKLIECKITASIIIKNCNFLTAITIKPRQGIRDPSIFRTTIFNGKSGFTTTSWSSKPNYIRLLFISFSLHSNIHVFETISISAIQLRIRIHKQTNSTTRFESSFQISSTTLTNYRLCT